MTNKPGKAPDGTAAPDTLPDKPAIPKVEQPDPRSPEFRRESDEEIDKERLDP